MEKKITLYNYLMWITENDENNIDANLIKSELLLNPDADDDCIMEFYNKYKNSELLEFKEEYEKGDYRLGYYNTKVSFYIEGMENGYFEITDVNGSFLYENNLIPSDNTTTTPKNMSMKEQAEELLEQYNSASNINDIAVCAEHMADFIETFLNCPQ